jgi:hypothetical protein
MKVYLVPAGSSRFALYSEVASASESDRTADARSFWGRLKATFREAVDEGEAEANRPAGQPDPSKGRFRRLITRKLAEAVAEQRLLWRLRNEGAATLVHPEGMAPGRALELARTEFVTDHARHRRWLLIDAVVVAVTGPLFFFVPGPNLISWYFTFRAVGHFFSMRGASRGLMPGFFTPAPSRPLAEIGEAILLPREVRATRVAEAAEVLGLEKLPAFVARVAEH